MSRTDFELALQRVDVVSFDVFDTLLARRVRAPVDAFELVRSALASDELALRHHDVVVNYPHIRRWAEAQARVRKSEAAGGEPEISLPEIYALIKERCGLDNDAVEVLRRAELQVEAALLYGIGEGLALYQLAKASGKRLAAISDMYLPREVIHELLLHNGYDFALEMVFVSGDVGCSKGTGQLYRWVAERLGISPASWLHIGDNIHADIARAKEQGIHALHADWSAVVNTHSPSMRGANDCTVAAVVDFLKTPQAGEFIPDTAWGRMGYTVFGPLMFGFMVWVAHQLRSSGVQKVLFMARDAQLMHRLYVEYFQSDFGIAAEYVYGSRQALFPLSMSDWPMHRIWYLFGGKSKRTVADVFKLVGLDPVRHVADIQAVGFSGPDDLIGEEKSRSMHRLINRLYFQVMSKSANERQEKGRYLQNAVSGHENIALIDIGWSGNIQAALQRALGSDWAGKRVHGFYLGLLDSATQNMGPYSLMKGWMTSFANREEVQVQLTGNGGVELLEFALTADHGSTLGYRLSDGAVVPVLEGLDHEETYNQCAMQLQAGVQSYFKDQRYLLGFLSTEALISGEWMVPFMKLLTNPSREEADLFGALTHSDTTGSNHIRHEIAPKLSRWALVWKGRRYAAAMKAAYWKAGFIARNRL